MISKKIGILGGGKCYRREFYTPDHKNNYYELEKLSSTYLHSIQVDMWNNFEIQTNIWRKVAPRENPGKQAIQA